PIFTESYYDRKVPSFVKFIYVLQSAFYLHSTYATLFMDYIRSDFLALMMHHAVTCALLILSYFMMFYKIGILVLYVHDVTDILMEFAKMNAYLRNRDGKVYMIHEYIANVAFAIFTAAWIYFRLYLYPLKVLHSTTWCVYLIHKDGDAWLFKYFNGMLFFLQAIHIYWFYYITQIIVRILTGKMKEIDDIREDGDVPSPAGHKGSINSVSNGHIKNNPEKSKNK
ncbi:Ceramide synthase 1, partial [Cichlidogyrus casuarinus]